MHEIVTYEGIVLQKRSRREADVAVDILTPAGLLRATARSARKEESKLRYALEPLSFARYCLVRGRHEWRLTGAEAVSRSFLQSSQKARTAMARVSRLLIRLVAGVEPSPELFTTVVEGFNAFSLSETPDSLEAVLVLRILSHLGYLPHTEALSPFIEGDFDIELSAKALESRALLVRTINESLRATGL